METTVAPTRRAAAIPRLIRVRPHVGLNLLLRFENGEQKLFDMNRIVSEGGPVFAPLADAEAFRQVGVVNNGGGIEWESGADLSKESLYLGSARIFF